MAVTQIQLDRDDIVSETAAHIIVYSTHKGHYFIIRLKSFLFPGAFKVADKQYRQGEYMSCPSF